MTASRPSEHLPLGRDPDGSVPSGPLFPVVGVGASAGGLEAFTELLRHLPADTGMAFVLVQHLDPDHESALVDILSRATSLPVREIRDGEGVQADHVHVIPRDTTLTISAGAFRLEPRQRGKLPHRPIDSFFESLAQDRRDRAVGVVLSGTATDGTLGLEAIKAEGGITFAQDESARHDSMPRSAVAAGCVDRVLAPAAIAEELSRIARHPYLVAGDRAGWRREEDDRAEAAPDPDDTRAASPGGDGPQAADGSALPPSEAEGDGEPMADDRAYRTILLLLRHHSGVDFSLYKSTTIRRRIGRRMVLNELASPERYAEFLRDNAAELGALYSDVLISVTSFFRNPEMFDELRRVVLPRLFLQGRGDEPLRCWVLGCSTGQEAYSVAMTFVEAAEDGAQGRRLQVFATDLNEALLEKARQGLYAKSVVDDVSPQRLRRFFKEEEGGYRVSKMLREMVVFARQNLVSDPPFSRLDLISCRNLLIYLAPALQHRALPTLHYALRPGGFLLLGASESIGRFTDLFDVVDTKHKIYSKRPGAGFLRSAKAAREGTGRPGARPAPASSGVRGASQAGRDELGAQREADRATMSRAAPPGVLVNADLQVMQFRGATGTYLEPPPGKASFDVLKMVRAGLELPLRAAIGEARLQAKPARRDDCRFVREGRQSAVDLEVVPLTGPGAGCLLVLFWPREDARSGRSSPGPGAAPAPLESDSMERNGDQERVAALEAELAGTRDYLRSMQEQHEAASEALQGAHEQLQSANEELQSINEEMETSKEELESTNEELITVNEEMANRNAELHGINNDLVNLQVSSRLAIVLLGRDMSVRRFSPQAEKQFDLLATDTGRSIGQIGHKLALTAADGGGFNVESAAIEVVDEMREREVEVKDRYGRWHLLRLRPYITSDNRVEGAVLVVVDIDRLKRSEQLAEEALDHADSIVDTVREPLLVLDGLLRVQRANQAFYRLFQVAPAEVIGRPFTDMGAGEWSMPALLARLGDMLSDDASIEGLRVEADFRHLGPRTMLLNVRRMVHVRPDSHRILVAIEDVTDRLALARRAEQQAAELAVQSQRKDEFLAMLSHELRNPLAPMRSALHVLRVEERPPDEPPIVQEAREVIERQVANLTRLVSDLLEVSRVVSGRVRLEREVVDLARVVEHAIQTVSPLVAARRHALTSTGCPDPTWVDVDPTRMEEVFVNLLNNAAKYTSVGGRIDVECRRHAGEAIVTVRDNGIGIEPDVLANVFELFTQAHRSLDRAQGGLGIGLSLVRKLVEFHGGSVVARSGGLGKGSEFTVRLPLASPPPGGRSAVTPAAAAAGKGKPLRVLVVDDNVDGCAMLAHIVRARGHQTATAHTGPAALEAATRWHPDVILLDIGLPELDGYEVARRLRLDPTTRHVKLIAVTGYGTEDDVNLCRAAGFDAHLLKPIELSAVEALLATWSETR